MREVTPNLSRHQAHREKHSYVAVKIMVHLTIVTVLINMVLRNIPKVYLESFREIGPQAYRIGYVRFSQDSAIE